MRLRKIARATLATWLLFAGLEPQSVLTFSNVTLLTPTGGDDTAQLQTALEKCAGAVVPCRIELASGNHIASELLGVQILRGVRPHDEPSRFQIADNAITINSRGTGLFGPGDGILFIDVTGLDDPAAGGAIDKAEIHNNRIALGVDAYDAVFVQGDRGHVTVTHNELSGPALEGGVVVWNSRGTRIRHSDFSGFDPAPDVWLLDTTSECRVVQPGANVRDEGTGNVVKVAP